MAEDTRLSLHLVVMGVSGSGKSTVARVLAARLERDFLEADDLHPSANVAKMAAGIPLTDDDRLPWLLGIRDALTAATRAGRPTVVACSALKRSYRDVLRGAEGEVRFVLLHGSPVLLRSRVTARAGHFMPPSLLGSQLSTLEPLAPDEAGVVVDVDAAPNELVTRILAALP